MHRFIIIAAIGATIGIGTVQAAVPALPGTVGHRIDALPCDAWNCSKWIAVPGAPEKTTMPDDRSQRAADPTS